MGKVYTLYINAQGKPDIRKVRTTPKGVPPHPDDHIHERIAQERRYIRL